MTVLETITPDRELALAYCNLSYLFMSVEDAENTFSWAAKALVLADQLGDIESRIYALINCATLDYLAGNPRRPPRSSTASLRRPKPASTSTPVAPRGAVLLAPRSKSHADAERWLDDGLNSAPITGSICGAATWPCRVHGRSSIRADGIRRSSGGPGRSRSADVAGHRADRQAILGLVRARRGDPEWRSILDEAWHRAEPTGGLQRWELPALARAEAAWLEGEVPAVTSQPHRCSTLKRRDIHPGSLPA